MITSKLPKIIGVPREIKPNEYRVAMIPAQVIKLVNAGNRVLIGNDAGIGSGYSNTEYQDAGAIICCNKDVYNLSDMIVKVKEPLLEEYNLINPGQIVFTFFHFASSYELTQAMVKSGAICIAYETVTDTNMNLPILAPMSEIAGILAVQNGMKYLEKPFGGNGVLLTNTMSSDSGIVVIIGGGTAGVAAANLAANIGAEVYLLEKNKIRSIQLSNTMKNRNINIIHSESINITKYLAVADLIIGAVLIPGAASPKIITKDMISKMKPGSVFVDISIDQGGITEVSRPTTHLDPVFKYNNVNFYCVANMPGAVPHTATEALSRITFPYVEKIASMGWENAVKNDNGILNGVNIALSHVTNKPLAKLFNYDYIDLLSITNT
jgi:alanine dehydrogenase